MHLQSDCSFIFGHISAQYTIVRNLFPNNQTSDVWLLGNTENRPQYWTDSPRCIVPDLFLRRSACTGDIDNETLCANECENERDDNNPKKFNVVRYVYRRI